MRVKSIYHRPHVWVSCKTNSSLFILWTLIIILAGAGPGLAADFPVVDTGQTDCYGNFGSISCPGSGETYFGQDAQYSGIQPSYQDNGDGTITDLNTYLLWQKTPLDEHLPWQSAYDYCENLDLGGRTDWRMPTIKELYSLIMFYGSIQSLTPYINTDYFDFYYPDTSIYRIIDAQYWSNTIYVGTTMNGNQTAFGVNFADGRIKGYGIPGHNYVRCVCGGDNYGENRFVDNGDGTISDEATGLMWTKADSGDIFNWAEALNYAEGLETAGYTDWRLPNAKELQSIVDYTRAPEATDSSARGPAINPIFDLTETESWFWTGTTHNESGNGEVGVYVAFGRALGYDLATDQWIDVHGAGAQRSDPKNGDPDNYPTGRGPQNDQIRIYNYVRAVRGVSEPTTPPDEDTQTTETGGGGCFILGSHSK